MSAAWTWQAIEALHQDAPPLAELLPWRWVEDETVHVLADGSVGLAWALPLLDAELLAPEGREPMARALAGLLAALPAGVAFQWLLLSRPGGGPALDAWARGGPTDGFLGAMAAARRRQLEAPGVNGLQPRRIEALFTMRLWPARPAASWLGRPAVWGAPLGAARQGAADWRALAEALGRLRQAVETQLSVAGLAARLLGGQGVLDAVWPLLNPGLGGAAPRWDPERALHQQATESAWAFRPDGFTVRPGAEDALEGRVLSILTLPPATWPGLLTLPREAGGAGGLLELGGLGWLAISGTVLDQESALRRLRWKRTLAFQQRLTLLGDTAVEARRIKEELDELLDRAFTRQERVGLAAFHLVWLDRPAALGAEIERARALGGQLEVRLVPETLITLPCWLQALPFGYDPSLERFTRRGRRLLGDSLADLLPLYGGFRGTPAPAQLFLSRRGEVVGFDPWDAGTPQHMLVTGQTGSGKSFLVNDLILQQLRRGAAAFVLDKGDSYRRLAELGGGQYVRLAAEAPVTLNPCAGPGDADHQAFLLRLLAEMASGGDPRWALTRDEVGALGQVVARAFVQAGERELTLSELARGLEAPDANEDGLGRRLKRRLFPFLGEGPYGAFFDGPNAFRPHARLTVVELGELSAKPDLRAVMVLALMHAVRVFATGLPIDQRKLIVIDEAWSLLASEDAAAALAEAARTYRKLGAAAVFLSQRLEDFEGAQGKAVRDNCAIRWLLQQAPEAVPALQALLGLGPHETACLRSVGSRKGAFSEALLLTPRGSGLMRLAVDPLTYWAATTDPADRARWAAALAGSGGDPHAALAALAGPAIEVAAPLSLGRRIA